MGALLAVDLGLRTGLAAYDDTGTLLWYRSQNYGSPARLRRAVPGVLDRVHALTHLFLEGDRNLAEIWARAASRHDIEPHMVAAETWRAALLAPRLRRTGPDAKRNAESLAREIIERTGARKPTSLRHDAAEAILIGFWGATQLGWA